MSSSHVCSIYLLIFFYFFFFYQKNDFKTNYYKFMSSAFFLHHKQIQTLSKDEINSFKQPVTLFQTTYLTI